MGTISWNHHMIEYNATFNAAMMLIANELGDYNNPGPIRLVFHDPPLAIFCSHSKKR